MLQAFFNIWRIPDLRNRLLFTFAMLAIYRIGYFIPIPGVNQDAIQAMTERSEGTGFGNLMAFVGTFTGGSLSQSTIFALGVMPYISAAIIFQLLGSTLESLKKLKKEGPAGQQKIQEYTRWTTVALAAVQSVAMVVWLQSGGGDEPLVYAEYVGNPIFWITGVVGLTAGAVFLMWLGEQIDKYGIGNGVSLIITAGIVAFMDDAIMMLVDGFSLTGSDDKPYNIMTILFLLVSFVVVVAGSVVITQGQRRIPIQQAKHTRGRRVYGGQKAYLPLRVNHGGVMPIIFASSLLIFPSMMLSWMNSALRAGYDAETAGWFMSSLVGLVGFLEGEFGGFTGYLYVLVYVGLIYFFSYFWTTVQFNPEETATNLRDQGTFIPGLRPGPRTAEYLETVMERITYVGAGFLAIIAVIPTVVSGLFNINFIITQFLGGTGLLICVSVMLDFVQRIEAQLLMRNYAGFLGGGTGKGTKIRGTRGF